MVRSFFPEKADIMVDYDFLGAMRISEVHVPFLATEPWMRVLSVAPQGFTEAAQSGQVSGLTAYQATLPAGAIQPGSFTVTSGSDRLFR